MALTLAQLSDTLDDKKWSSLMVNEALTSVYFTALQVLRIMTEQINETVDCLTTSQPKFDGTINYFVSVGNVSTVDRKHLHENWDTLTAIMKRRQAGLLERIQRKTQEVESLRDGVWLLSLPLEDSAC